MFANSYLQFERVKKSSRLYLHAVVQVTFALPYCIVLLPVLSFVKVAATSIERAAAAYCCKESLCTHWRKDSLVAGLRQQKQQLL
jgi:hypothetical protein